MIINKFILGRSNRERIDRRGDTCAAGSAELCPLTAAPCLPPLPTKCRAGAHASVALGLPVGAGVCGRANCRSYSPACTHTVRAGPGGGVMGGWAPARATPSAFAIATKQTPTPVAFPNAHFQHQGDGWMDGCTHAPMHACMHGWIDGC
jgi:hypothetical protein